MKRTKPGNILFVLFVFCSPSFLCSQQPPQGVKLLPVTGQIYMLQGNGGNVGVLADPAGALVIDSMYESSAGQIRSAIKSLPGGEKIRILVNTHWHSDHTDGNKALGTDALIIAHENVRPLLAGPQTLLGQSTPAYPSNALPAVTYSDRLNLFIGDEPVSLVHYPHAHTNGDTVVFFDKSKVVHMGDMFFNGLFPYMDVANGGDIESWGKQLDSIIAVLPSDVKIIPGHGPLAGLSDLKAFRRMLDDSADIVRREIQEGKTLDQIKAAGLPARFDPWTKGFFTTPQWLELVYQSLQKKH